MHPIGLGYECLANIAGRSDQNTRSIRPGKGKHEADFATTGSRKENGVRVSRQKSPISAAAIRRTIQAAMQAGLPIGRRRVDIDGTIRLSVAQTSRRASTTSNGILRAWGSISSTRAAAGTSVLGAAILPSCRQMEPGRP